MSKPETLFALSAIVVLASLPLATPALAGVSLPESISNLDLWLRADKGVESANGVAATDGQDVQFWRDQSGQNNHATQNDNSRRFAYRTSSHLINGMPTLDVDSGDWMQGASGFGAGITATYFVVGQISAAAAPSSWPAIFTSQASGSSNNLNGVAFHMNQNGTQLLASLTAGGGEPAAAFYPTQNPGLNNPFLVSAVDAGNALNTAYRLADFTDGNLTNRKFNGDLAEIVLFDRQLNAAERIAMENYLGAKYGIAVGDNDRYAGDDPGKGNYDFDVFGIGRSGDDQLLTSAWAGLALSAGSLADGQWVMAGHRTPVNSLTDAELAGTGALERWQRVWYIEQTNIGTDDALALTFSFTEAGLDAPTHDEFALLYSETNAFAWTNLGLVSEFDGSNSVTFSLTGDNLADGYYTLGVVPEPTACVLLLSGLLAMCTIRRRRGA